MTGVQTCALPICVMPKGAVACPMVSAGQYHTLALKSDGSLWSWGYNNYGQLGDGTSGSGTDKSAPVQVKGAGGSGNLSDIVAVAAGSNHSVALKSDGSLWAWGHNGNGQLGDGTTTSRTLPVQVTAPSNSGYLSDIVAVGAGSNHSMALKSDGSLWAWGYNNYGQLGDGTTSQRNTPVQVKAPSNSGYLSDIVAVGAGYNDSMALKSDGSVWAWGYNYYGQLGIGTSGSSTDKSAPVQVKGAGGSGYLADVVAISAGDYFGMALKTDGSVWAWGYNSFGNLGDSTTEQKSYPVQVSFGRSLNLSYAAVIDKTSNTVVSVFDKRNPMPPVIRIKENQKFKIDRSKIAEIGRAHV